MNQITGLIDRGHAVDIYAYGRESELETHADVAKYQLLDRTHYYGYSIPDNKVLRLQRAVPLIRSAFHKKPEALLRSLNVFKFGREAASLRMLYKIAPFLGKGPYDIMHCHFGPNGDLGVVLKMLGLAGGKVVTTFHGYDIRLGLEKGGGIYQRLFKTGDLFLAISQYNRRKLVNLGLDERKIIDHPVGIDLKKFPDKWMADATGGRRLIRLITVARLVKEKGLDCAIRAIHKVLLNKPGLELEYTIVGGGPLREELEELVGTLNLRKYVRFVGAKSQEEVVGALAASDIFMLPSVAEALPVVAMEAQAIGLPVIATSVGSVDQIVLNGKTGFCVPPADADAIAAALCLLIEHTEVWPVMGRSGREHVAGNFSIDTLNDRLVELFAGIRNREITDSGMAVQ
ncbi:MAG: glycosyltransferase [Nitrospiraceae bacterium]|nr:glycosyltransferase [Nitrospiraceae bacterium]